MAYVRLSWLQHQPVATHLQLADAMLIHAGAPAMMYSEARGYPSRFVSMGSVAHAQNQEAVPCIDALPDTLWRTWASVVHQPRMKFHWHQSWQGSGFLHFLTFQKRTVLSTLLWAPNAQQQKSQPHAA